MAIISEVTEPVHAQINMMFCDFVVCTWVSDVGCPGWSFTLHPHAVAVPELLTVRFTVFICVSTTELCCPVLHENIILFGSRSTVCLMQTTILVKHLSLNGVFTLPDTDTDTHTDKNGLYRIVWRCLHCTETTIPFEYCRNLLVSVSVSVPVSSSVNTP